MLGGGSGGIQYMEDRWDYRTKPAPRSCWVPESAGLNEKEYRAAIVWPKSFHTLAFVYPVPPAMGVFTLPCETCATCNTPP